VEREEISGFFLQILHLEALHNLFLFIDWELNIDLTPNDFVGFFFNVCPNKISDLLLSIVGGLLCPLCTNINYLEHFLLLNPI
jgi:hypothetical protein